MLFTILLFSLYSVIGVWFILKLPIFKTSGVMPKTIIALFAIKLLGGICYHYINTVRFYGGDAHSLFIETSTYAQTLFTDPSSFFNYFIYGWNSFNLHEKIFSTNNAIAWSCLSNQVNFRILTICNILSFNTEIVNYVFYNIIFFIGQFALFRMFAMHYPTRKGIILLFIALVPSVWFWCSGVHKDGFVLSFIGFTLYYFHQYFITKKTKYLFGTVLFLILAISIRYYLAISLLPMFGLYVLANYFKTKTRLIFISGFSLYIILFFNISTIFTSVNPPEIICKKQAEFMSLKGDSFIPMPMLQPTAKSFLTNLPIALNHCLNRPYITESKDIMYVLCAAETLVLFILLIWLLAGLSFHSLNTPLVLFGILFSTIMFIIIGYIVPFGGAFIRYRSEYFAFIYCALLGVSKWGILDSISNKANKYLFL